MDHAHAFVIAKSTNVVSFLPVYSDASLRVGCGVQYPLKVRFSKPIFRFDERRTICRRPM